MVPPYQRVSRGLFPSFVRRSPAYVCKQYRKASRVLETKATMRGAPPEDGVKLARDLAEELREETGVQLDEDAWRPAQEVPAAPEQASVWYFAFGSNMNKAVFEGRRMIKPAKSVAAVLPGYRLAFNMPGMPYREPAFAGVERVPAATGADSSSANNNSSNSSSLDKAVAASPVGVTRGRLQQVVAGAGNSTNGNGSLANGTASSASIGAEVAAREVHGVAHHITSKEWQYVLETEGAVGNSEFGYKVEAVKVLTYDGRELDAFTLACQPRSVAFLKGREALPSRRYLELLQVGAREHSLAPAYQAYLDSLQPYEASTPTRRLGAVAMAAVFLVLVAPVFAAQRLYAKLTGMSSSQAAGSLRGQVVARYLHTAFALAWGMEGWLQPLLGCGCTNAVEGSGNAARGSRTAKLE